MSDVLVLQVSANSVPKKLWSNESKQIAMQIVALCSLLIPFSLYAFGNLAFFYLFFKRKIQSF